jgi:hypothetical protein
MPHNDDKHTGPDPAWIQTTGPAEAEALLAEVYAGIAGRSGSVANILQCQPLHPEALRRLADGLGVALEHGDES